jgi:hypothetical protein
MEERRRAHRQRLRRDGDTRLMVVGIAAPWAKLPAQDETSPLEHGTRGVWPSGAKQRGSRHGHGSAIRLGREEKKGKGGGGPAGGPRRGGWGGSAV